MYHPENLLPFMQCKKHKALGEEVHNLLATWQTDKEREWILQFKFEFLTT